MSSPANVLSFRDIEDFRIALVRFQSEALETLKVAEQDIRSTTQSLEDRQQYWKIPLSVRRDVVEQARQALARCQASAYHGHGQSYIPDCSRYEHELRRAHNSLREAEENLQTVQKGLRFVQEAVGTYQREAQRLSALLQNDVPKATALLSAKVTLLYDYATGASTSHFTPLPQKSVSTTAPIQGLSSSSQVERSGGDVEGEPNKESLEGRGRGPEYG
jgi:hypothetical protein